MRTKVVFSAVILLCCSSVVFTFPLARHLNLGNNQNRTIQAEGNVTAAIPDFPRRTLNAALTGAAPKLAVRLMPDGSYSNMASDAEYQEVYENAEDLAQHLKTYVLRKEQENPNWTREFNLERTKRGVEAKMRSDEWDLEPEELNWVMKRLVELLA